MNRNIYITIAAALALIALGVWYAKIQDVSDRPSAEPAVEEGAVVTSAEQLGGDLLEKAQNPLKDELPQTNPFTGAETNPFIDVYENPFAQ